MRREHISAAELVQEFDISEEAIEALLQSLVEKGYLARVPGTPPPRYKVALGRRRVRQVPIRHLVCSGGQGRGRRVSC